MNHTLTLAQQTLCNATELCPALFECINGMCEHKSVLPLTPREILGSVLIVTLGGLANAGGMGGGFIITPILVTIFKYDPVPAIRLVYGMIFGGAIGNFINTAANRDPKTQKPMINYDVSLICIPMLLCGTTVGVIVKSWLPPIFTILSLFTLTVQVLMKLWTRAKKAYETETQQQHDQVAAEAQARKKPVEIEMQNKAIPHYVTHRASQYAEYISVIGSPHAKFLSLEDKIQFPWKRYKEILMLLAVVMIMLVLRGTQSIHSILGVDYCTPGYWSLYAVTLGICFYFGVRGKNLLVAEAEVREKALLAGAPLTQDLKLTPDRVTSLSTVSLLAGVLAGMLGIGGGMLLGTRMIDMGLNGQQATATSGFFIVFTSSLALFQTLIGGELNLQDFLYFSSLTAIGAFSVSFVLKRLVDKYKRPSIMLFALCYAIIIGVAVMPFYTIIRTMEDPKVIFGFGSLC